MSLLDFAKQNPDLLKDFLMNMRSIRDARYALGSMCALQLYEWLLLLDREIQLIYKSRLSVINVTYFLCRYYPAALWVMVMWGIVANHPPELCIRVVKPINALLAPCQFIPQGVMVMRAYAFTSRDGRVLTLLSTCYAILVGVNIWVFCIHVDVPLQLYTVLGHSGCFPNYGEGVMAMRIGFTILASTLMDLVSLIVVLVYCYKYRLREISLGRYFVKQGLGAFALVCAINITCIILYFRPPSYKGGIGLPVMLVLPNLVACRVILQLRQHCQAPSDSEISADSSRIVREALNPDAWTID